MSMACRELEVALSLRAVGGLDPSEGARLDAHLAECPDCRAEAARDAELLGLAHLPPPSLLERRVLADLPARVAAQLRPEEAALLAPASLRAGRRLATGLLVAIGIAAIAIVPAMYRREPPPDADDADPAVEAVSETAAGAGSSAWEGPDLDALWQDAAVVVVDAG